MYIYIYIYTCTHSYTPMHSSASASSASRAAFAFFLLFGASCITTILNHTLLNIAGGFGGGGRCQNTILINTPLLYNNNTE